MKAKSPLDGKWYYFIDKCMPFGSSISCAHFQEFSNAISHVMHYRCGHENVNYLDDFLFIAFLRWVCNNQVEVFLEICELIQFPVALEKTFWADTLMTFLGMLIDTKNQLILIPSEKISKAQAQINRILNSRRRKATVLQIQQLCGLLNFLCRAIVPGRPFSTRLYACIAGYKQKNLKQYHHVSLSKDMILDLQMWDLFLKSPACFSRPFLDFDNCIEARQMDWYTDSAKSLTKGFGGHYHTH